MSAETFSFSVGDFECTAIADMTNLQSAIDLVPDVDEKQLKSAVRSLGIDPGEIPVGYNCLLVRTGLQNVLFDAGFGTRLEPNEGWLLQGLHSMGLEPRDIDRIIITHGDRDHISGILDREGELVFSNARYTLWQGAWDYWSTPERHPEGRAEVAAFVTGTYNAIQDRLDLVPSETEIIPGIRLISAVGHRHDHCVVRISSQGEQLLHLGDAVIHPVLMARREWYSSYDDIPEKALSIKAQWLDWAAMEKALIFASHFPMPAVGHVRQQDPGWLWLPL